MDSELIAPSSPGEAGESPAATQVVAREKEKLVECAHRQAGEHGLPKLVTYTPHDASQGAKRVALVGKSAFCVLRKHSRVVIP